MTTAIYTRVSTKKQVEEGYSLEAQKERLESICKANNDIIYKIYSDEGKSGKNTNRPAFQEMMQDMRNKKFDKILVMKLDRISRSISDLEQIIQETQKYNVSFESASEKIDTSSSMGMMFVRLLGVFAQFERERITERINDAFEQMVQENRALSGKQPYGYIVQNKKVVIDKEKIEHVKYFLNQFDETHSLYRSILNTNTNFNLNRGAKEWKKALFETKYYGTFKNNTSYCEPIISKEKLEELQNILKNKNIKKTQNKRTYLFSSLLICPECEMKLCSRFSKSSYYYRCSRSIYGHCNNHQIVTEGKLEKMLLEHLNYHLINYLSSLDVQKIKYTKKDFSKKIALLEEEKKRTTISFNKGRMSEQDYDLEYIRLDKEIEKLKNTTQQIKDVSSMQKFIDSHWQEKYKQLNKEEQKLFWLAIIDKIELDSADRYNFEKAKIYFK